jgi:hypothetical protein
MLFQLNQLKITPDSFRLLYAIITAAYHSKVLETTHKSLQKDSRLSEYKVRNSLLELKKEKLITTKTSTDGIKIVLGQQIIEMIYLDYTKKGASQRTRNMAEIKKSQPPKQEVEATKCQTLSTQSLTPSNRQNTSKPSLRSTSKKGILTETVSQTPKQVQTAPEKPPTKPTKPPTTKRPPSKPRTSQKLKASDKKPYITTRGTLYKFFEEWLKNYEILSELDIACLLKKDDQKMMRYWINFQDYARCWLSRNRQIERPERDLNKIKAMKKFAGLAKAS